MNSQEPSGSVAGPRIRMDTGVDVLEKWSAGATEEELDLVHGALFSMTDGTLFRSHRIVDDWMELSQFFVLLPGGLMLTLRMHCFDSFGVVYVGPLDRAPRRPVLRRNSTLAPDLRR